MQVFGKVAGFLTPSSFETISVPTFTAASLVFGTGANGVITVSIARSDGNDFILQVVQPVTLNASLSVTLTEETKIILVSLGTDGAGAPSAIKNTATLVAAALDALTNVSASASGTGASVIVAPVGANDSSGSSFAGNFEGSPTLGSTGAINKTGNTAVTFDGVDDAVNVGDPESLRITGPHSIEFWIKYLPDGIGSFVLSHGTDAISKGYLINITSLGNLRWLAYTSVADENIFTLASGIAPFGDGVWHHCVLTWDGTTDTNGVKMYKDGVLLAQTTANPGDIDTASGYKFLIGRNQAGTNYFTGSIDEFVVYAGKVLTAVEVAEHYALRLNTNDGYGEAVLAKAPTLYWKLNEVAGGPTEYGFFNGIYGYGLTISKLIPSNSQTARDLGKVRLVTISIEDTIRYTLHGAFPQVSSPEEGHLAIGGSMLTFTSRQTMLNFRAIAVTGTVKLQVSYFR